MTEQAAEFLHIGAGDDTRNIAFLHRRATSQPDAPLLVWLGGYRSDMTGTKAVELDRFAAENGLACLRLDYSGHGASGGDFNKGTMSRWLEEALAVVNAKAPSRVVLVEGDDDNLKLTSSADIALAEALLARRREQQRARGDLER